MKTYLNLALNYISVNLANIIVTLIALLIVIIVLVVMWKRGRKKQVKAFILEAVTRAELAYGSKTGQIKYNAVVTWFYNKYPIISFFISKSKLNEYIQEAFDKLEEVLSRDGATLLNYADEQNINSVNALNSTYTAIDTTADETETKEQSSGAAKVEGTKDLVEALKTQIDMQSQLIATLQDIQAK